MEKIYFQCFGVIALLLDLGCILIELSPRVNNDFSDHKILIRLFILHAVLLSVGIGLLFLRKWAAIYFSLVLFAWAIVLFFGSILYVPFPFNLINFPFAFACALPALTTIKFWNSLVWGGRFYV